MPDTRYEIRNNTQRGKQVSKKSSDVTSEELIRERVRFLHENTDFVYTLFDRLTGYAIVAADFDGNIIAYNEGAKGIFGYSPEEVIGKLNTDRFFPRELKDSVKQQDLINRLIETGAVSLEGEAAGKGERSFPGRYLFTLTKDKNGNVVGFVAIIEDLTVSKEYLASILDSTIDAIIEVDENGLIRSVNRATLEMFGYREESLIGKNIGILASGKKLTNALKSMKS